MATALRKYKSLYSSTTNSFGTGTGETVTPASVTGLPSGEITLTFDRVDSSGVKTPTKMERITGSISGGNFVISARGVDGTTEQTHTSPVVEMVWNTNDWNDAIDTVLAQHTASGTHTAITASTINGNTVATGTDAVVLVTASQTLTNKTLTSPTVNNPTTKSTTQVVAAVNATVGGTTTLDLSAGGIQNITMGDGNTTIALSNVTTNQPFIISITQDGGGSRTVTWFSTIKWAGGSAPTLTTTADKRDTFGFICTGTNTYDGYVVGQNI